MKISYNWLKDFIDIDPGIDEVSRILTNTGLEVEGVHVVGGFPGGLAGLVVGEVKTVGQHPDADRLKCTTVDVGQDELLNIVCGAPNVAVGQKVAVATVGTTLHPVEGEPFKIKKSKIRGQLSMGMLCAEDEIGIGRSHDGIMVLDTDSAVGTPLNQILKSNEDQLIEIGLTPNRTDAISHFGVARDLAAYLAQENEVTLSRPDTKVVAEGEPTISIEIQEPSACSRYCGVELSKIQVAPSPEWMQDRLKTIGLSPINNVVDITNYVMHETGQPLHAFDMDKIEGSKVIVRLAEKEELFTSLDEKERKLDKNDLLIANAKDGMCMAGVFGGIDSGVTESTTKVFLESACFDMVSVRKTAKRHQLNTDSSFRFERGVDPNGVDYALRRALDLLVEHSGAEVSSSIQDIYPKPIGPWPIQVDLKRMDQLIGKVIPRDRILGILESLDFEVDQNSADSWTCHVPTYRVEVTREADVVEEVLRIYGYNEVELPSKMNVSVQHVEGVQKHELIEVSSSILNGLGFSEMMNNSLSSSNYSRLINKEEGVKILNPLSTELDQMRQTLLWGAMEVVSYNLNRKQSDIRLFEFGSVYAIEKEAFSQNERLALVMCGSRYPENWSVKSESASIHDMRGVLDSLLSRFMDLKSLTQEEHDSPLFDQSISLNKGNSPVATMGVVAQNIRKHFDIEMPVYFASLSVQKLVRSANREKLALQSIPKFPSVRRDFSLLLNKGVHYNEIEKAALSAGGKLVKSMNLFDVYEGKNLPEGKMSMAVSFELSDPDRTLTDKVVDKCMNKMKSALETQLGAELRS